MFLTKIDLRNSLLGSVWQWQFGCILCSRWLAVVKKWLFDVRQVRFQSPDHQFWWPILFLARTARFSSVHPPLADADEPQTLKRLGERGCRHQQFGRVAKILPDHRLR